LWRSGIRLAGQPSRGRLFLRFVEERDPACGAAVTGALVSAVCGGARCYFVSQKLWSGDAPEPPNDRRAPSPWARSAGAGSPDGARGRRGHRQPFRRRERPSTRFRSPIIRREDVEFLGRKLETGGTPTLPGVEFVRYSRSHGLGFRQTAPKTPRMAVRPVFPGSTGIWGA